MKTLPPKLDTYTEHAADILDAAASLVAQGVPFTLVTSVGIKGGAAREVGTLALVDADGHMTGYLSNGCIDKDIQLRAMTALEAGQKELVRYGDGSKFADLKLPCGGALDVLIDPQPDVSALMAAHKSLGDRQPATLAFALPDQDIRSFTYRPKVRLCLAGRGAIFRSMAQLGAAAGFEVALLSPETEDLDAVGAISSRPPIHLTSPHQDVSLDMLDQHAAFLTLFHDHDWEPALLMRALDRPTGFVGALGSRKTHALRIASLTELGATTDMIDRIHGPIGLINSLRDASLIAVSALAEIVEAFPTQITPADP